MRESANVFCLTGRDRDAAFDPIVRRLAAKCEKARFRTRVKSKQQPVITTDKFTPRYRGRAPLRFGAKSHVRPRRSPAQAEHFAQHLEASRVPWRLDRHCQKFICRQARRNDGCLSTSQQIETAPGCGLRTALSMRHEHSSKCAPRPPLCPSCAQSMRLVRITSRFGDLPDLYTFECRACGVSHIEAA
jgi:hypothetical protein